MNYFKTIKENQYLKEALWEIPAGFIFVIIYFLIISKFTDTDAIGSLISGSLLFSGFWFLLVKLVSFKAKVHILPVISFIDSLLKDDFSIFLYRLPGQFFGGLLAVMLILLSVQPDYSLLFHIQFVPVDSFFTGIFTGFMAQIIYFLWFVLFYKNTSYHLNFRLFLFSLGLGVLFLIITQTGNITLLNPFGILFSSLLYGHPLSLSTFLIGSVIHVIVPMLFIAGTHYFLTGFVFKNNQY